MERLSHYKELDGIRAIAAIMVMCFHIFQGTESSNFIILTLKKFAVFGQTGVSLFFVLSGFLITRILLNTKHTNGFFKNFYIRRSLRIFPLYFLFLLLYYLIFPIIHIGSFVQFNHQWFYWTYLQNFAMTFNWPSSGPGHFWSLAIEEHFYLFWPFLIFFLTKRKLVFSIILIVAFAFLTRLLLISCDYGVFYFTFSRFDELAIGSLLAIIENKGLLNRKSVLFFLLTGILSIIFSVTLWTYTTGQGLDYIQLIKFPLLSLVYFSIIGVIISLNGNTVLEKTIGNPALTFSGRISYGLYVYHPTCFFIIGNFLKTESFILNTILSFGLTFIISALSYQYFERHFLSLKSRYNYKIQPS